MLTLAIAFASLSVGIAIGLLIARMLPQSIVVHMDITRVEPEDGADFWKPKKE